MVPLVEKEESSTPGDSSVWREAMESQHGIAKSHQTRGGTETTKKRDTNESTGI